MDTEKRRLNATDDILSSVMTMDSRKDFIRTLFDEENHNHISVNWMRYFLGMDLKVDALVRKPKIWCRDMLCACNETFRMGRINLQAKTILDDMVYLLYYLRLNHWLYFYYIYFKKKHKKREP